LEADFYRHEHRLIYAATAQLYNAGKQVDIITVFEHLKPGGKADEVGGLVYLNALASYVPSAANIRRHAEIVRERSIQRRLIAASEEISTLAYAGGKNPDELISEAESAIGRLSDTKGSTDDWEGTEEGVIKLLDRLQNEYEDTVKPDVVDFGLDGLNKLLDGGGRPGELIIIAARPGIGKTALGLTIADHAASNGHVVGFMSMEMLKAELHKRRMAIRSHIHLSRLKVPKWMNNDDWSRLTEGVERLRGTSLYVSDQSGLNINQVRAKAKMLKRKHGLRVLVIDYLGLMAGTNPKDMRTYQIEQITTGLKILAKELGITVLLLAQVKRTVDDRVDKMPILSDLKDSGAIEQDADIIIFIHREAQVKKDLGPEWKHHGKIHVAKNRSGPTGEIDVMYIGEHTQFKDWPAEQQLPASPTRTKRADL
jgi:replicative DNA helicase